MTQPELSAAFRGSPMKRAKRRGLAREAAVVMGNVATAEDIMPLLEAALEHDDPLVREQAAWALGQDRLTGHRRRPASELPSALAGDPRTP